MKKLIILLVSLSSIIHMSSCRKETGRDVGFIQTIDMDTQFAAMASYETADRSLIIVGRSFDNSSNAWMVKLSEEGNEIWRKPVSGLNKKLWHVLPLRSGGFITVGTKEDFDPNYVFCRYSDDGVLLDTTSEFPRSGTSVTGIELKNGDLLYAFSNNVINETKVFRISTNLEQIAYFRLIEPAGFLNMFVTGMCQVSDTSVAFATSSVRANTSRYRINASLLQTGFNGSVYSKTLLEDSLVSEIPGFLGRTDNGFLWVSSTMNGWMSGDGTMVDYNANSNAMYVSGKVNLVRFDRNGQFVARKRFFNYPGNGMIISGKPTRDGGFILCGTVNQNNSQTIVSNTRLFLLKLDGQGNAQWSRVIDTNTQAIGMDVIELWDGGYCLTGHHRTFNKQFNMLVVKTDRNGNIVN